MVIHRSRHQRQKGTAFGVRGPARKADGHGIWRENSIRNGGRYHWNCGWSGRRESNSRPSAWEADALGSRRRYHAYAQGQSGRQKRCQQSVLAKDALAIGGGLFEAGEVRIVLAEEEVRGDEQAAWPQ